MTIAQMHEQLALRLEDVEGHTFNAFQKNIAISIAQRVIATILDASYLKELEAKRENLDITFTSDPAFPKIKSVNLAKRKIFPYAGKITLIKTPTPKTGKQSGFCNIIRPEFIDLERNDYLESDDGEVTACPYGHEIFFLIKGTEVSPKICHVYYIRDPEDLTRYGDLLSSSPLSPTLHLIVLDIAEAELWHRDRKHARSLDAYAKGYSALKTLNARVEEDYKDIF
tara:strand:+ start:283 stop:960 length:678 start_codon:yes stop_codon:yes gene_type:complete